MGYTKYDLDRLRDKENDIQRITENIDSICGEFKGINNTIDIDIKLRDNIYNQFNTLMKDLENLVERTFNADKVINLAIFEYSSGEQQINTIFNGLVDIANMFHDKNHAQTQSDKTSITGINIVQKWFRGLKDYFKSKIDHIRNFLNGEKIRVNNKDYSKAKNNNSDVKISYLSSSQNNFDYTNKERIKPSYNIEKNYKTRQLRGGDIDKNDELTNKIKEGSKVLKNIFNTYSFDAGIVDIDPQTGQVIINHNFIPNIGLSYYKDRNNLNRLDNGMIGTKYYLDIKTGMISYNGQSTNNSISEESQWEIKYKYDLGEMKQLRIDAKNLVDNILIQQGTDLNHEYINKLNKKIDFWDNPIIEGGSKIYDFGSTVGLKAGQGFKEYLSLTGQPSYALFGGVLGAIEGAIQYKTEPSAEDALNNYIYELKQKKYSYWKDYNTKLDNIVSSYSNKESSLLKEKYYHKAIVDYANNMRRYD